MRTLIWGEVIFNIAKTRLVWSGALVWSKSKRVDVRTCISRSVVIICGNNLVISLWIILCDKKLQNNLAYSIWHGESVNSSNIT